MMTARFLVLTPIALLVHRSLALATGFHAIRCT
jgi:hypothetical protein